MPTTDHQLLADFAASKSEAAFRSLVDRHAANVLAVALRKTGSQPLAEEITQNVFAVLARKATSLNRKTRPRNSLAGWLHRSTVLEAKTQLRKEYNRRRKMDQLARQAEVDAQPDTSPDPPHADLLPALDDALAGLPDADRNLLLGHYFDDRTYADIASDLKKSEPATRKQASRALAKIAAHLKSHHHAVGVTAVSAALAAGYAKAATPVTLTTNITGAALAAAPNITTLTLLTHTLNTMAYLKTKTALAVAIVAALPATVQLVQTSELNASITMLSSDITAMEQTVAAVQQATASPAGPQLTIPSSPAPPLTADAIDLDALARDLRTANSNMDMTAIAEILTPLGTMPAHEASKLLVRLAEHDIDTASLSLIGQAVVRRASDHDPAAAAQFGLDHLPDPGLWVHSWVRKDTPAALAWIFEKLDSGELAGKRVHDDTPARMLSSVVSHLVPGDPDAARQVLGVVDEKLRDNIITEALTNLAAQHHHKAARSLADLQPTREESRAALTGYATSLVQFHGFETAENYLGTLDLDPPAYAATLTAIASQNLSETDPSTRAAHLLENLPDADKGKHLGDFAAAWTHSHEMQQATNWIFSQRGQPHYDNAAFAYITSPVMRNRHLKSATKFAGTISDPTLRQQALDILRK